uniref:Sperm-lysin n=1 Tax=Romanomermis culicivorax TaxID=13658 RepID=A0A915LBE9_ROMCU
FDLGKVTSGLFCHSWQKEGQSGSRNFAIRSNAETTFELKTLKIRKQLWLKKQVVKFNIRQPKHLLHFYCTGQIFIKFLYHWEQYRDIRARDNRMLALEHGH